MLSQSYKGHPAAATVRGDVTNTKLDSLLEYNDFIQWNKKMFAELQLIFLHLNGKSSLLISIEHVDKSTR